MNLNTLLVVGATALAGCASSPWGNIQPAYTSKGQATFRLEGGLDSAVKLYGFLDAYPKTDDPAHFETAYGLARGTYFLTDVLGAAAEPTFTRGADDTLRLGAVFRPSLWEGNLTEFRIFPYDTADFGAQYVVFTQQKTGNWDFRMTAKRNEDAKRTFYLEPEIGYKITDTIDVFLQGRISGEHGRAKNSEALLGFKVNF